MKHLLIALSVLSLAGCSTTYTERTYYYNSNRIVTLYSGMGQIIRQWHTRGKVYSEEHSDGYFFRDKATGHVVTVGGTVVIEMDAAQ